jgi:tellurite methyltransferase
MQQSYDDKYAGEAYYWGRAPSTMARRILEFIQPTDDFHPLLLDIGCGEGRDAVHFARLGFRVVGLDASERGLEKTRALADEFGVEVETLCADLKAWEPDREYDVIFSTGALQYLPAHVRGGRFAQYKAATAPGGIHILSVFVHKPFIPPAPDANEDEILFWPGEMLEYYDDWEIPHFAEDIFDCDSGGVPHRHAMQRIAAWRYRGTRRDCSPQRPQRAQREPS